MTCLGFLEIQTFCHTERSPDDSVNFVLNYVRWEEVKPRLEKRVSGEQFEIIRNFYRSLYKGEGLIAQLAGNKLRDALEFCSLYPEQEGKDLS